MSMTSIYSCEKVILYKLALFAILSHCLQVFCSPYKVVLDTTRKAIVVAIRGTLSVEVRIKGE